MHGGLMRKQRGATFLGMLTIASILGLALYAGIRLVPRYMDYFSAVQAKNAVATSLKDAASPGEVRRALEARWTVDYINDVDPKEDIEVTKVGNGMEMHLNYEARAPFIGNISFAIEFDKTVTIIGSR